MASRGGLGLALGLIPNLGEAEESPVVPLARAEPPPGEWSESERHVVLGPILGVWAHGFDSGSMASKVGPVWGALVAVRPLGWLDLEGMGQRGDQPMAFHGNGYGQDEATLSQSPLEITRLGLRMLPTMTVLDELELSFGLGVGWNRVLAAPPTTTNGPRVDSFRRSATFVDYELVGSLRVEPIPDWLRVELSMSYAILRNRSGSLFDSTQAFSQGHRLTLDGLPRVTDRWMGNVFLGVVL